MSKESSTLFLINKTLSYADQQRVLRLSENVDRSQVEPLTYDLNSLSNYSTVILAGGDGSVKYVSGQLNPEQTLVILPLGSYNGFAENLHTEVTLEELRSGIQKEIPIIYPARINGESFVHAASWDDLGVTQGIVTENLRWVMPRWLRGNRPLKKLRGLIGAVHAAVSFPNAANDEYPISMAITGSSFGPFQVHESHTLESDTVLIGRVRGGKGFYPRMIQIFNYLFQRKVPANGLIEFTEEQQITIPLSYIPHRVNVDGEVVQIKTDTSSVYVERNREKGIRAAVLRAW